MEAELERSFEALLNGLAEARLGVQPRHLIFVLIGHQPEERSCDRPRELVAVWKDGRFRRARALHNVGIASRIGGVLIISQERDTAGDLSVKRRRADGMWRTTPLRPSQYGRQTKRPPAPPHHGK